jgi:hypothetical protein
MDEVTEVTETKARPARTKPARPAGDVIVRTIYDVRQSRPMSAGIRALESRSGEFESVEQLELAGLAMVPEARAMLEDRLEEEWAGYDALPGSTPELVIGSGYHAAVYCLARVAAGYPRPYVLERSDARGVGGVWAMSRAPGFYLNSRQDTFASIGLPDDGSPSLNTLPGAPVQAHHISRTDFIDNSVMRLIVRLALARSSTLLTGANVRMIRASGSRNQVELRDGRVASCGRIVDARGLGDPADTLKCDGVRVLSFPQLMARMDSPFPLRGMGRVAVVGDSSSAMCAVESLLGIGPDQSMSSSALDFQPAIDWYAPELPDNRAAWRGTVRGRYQKIGSYLRRSAGDAPARRLRVRQLRASVVSAGGTVLVNEFTYDHAVMCTGWALPALTADDTLWGGYSVPGSTVALGQRWSNRNVYRIGPAANIVLSPAERTEAFSVKQGIEVSMLRLATRTRALATFLPATA